MAHSWFSYPSGFLCLALLWGPFVPPPAYGAEPLQEAPEPLEGETGALELGALLQTLRLQVALGQGSEAEETLSLIGGLYPDSLEEAEAIVARGPRVETPPGAIYDADGQAEFIASQTILGTVAGVALPIMGSADSPKPFAIGALLGAAAGLGGSLAYSAQGPVTVPEAQSFYWSQVYTATNLNLWSAVINGGEQTDTGLALSTAGGVLLGLPLGYGLHQYFPRTSGQLAMTSSAGVWGAYFGGLLVVAQLETLRLDSAPLVAAVALTTDVALIGAYAAVKDLAISRGRVRLINLGGTLGGVVATTVLIFKGGGVEPLPIAGLFFGTTGAGLAMAAVLTQGYDAKRNPELFAHTNYPALFSVKEGRLALGQLVPLAFQGTFSDDNGRPVIHQGLKMNLIGGEF